MCRVVNIDNGFGAACIASLINHLSKVRENHSRRPASLTCSIRVHRMATSAPPSRDPGHCLTLALESAPDLWPICVGSQFRAGCGGDLWPVPDCSGGGGFRRSLFCCSFSGCWYLLRCAPCPGATSDIHLRAPVRLFFEWDPLVALSNALASHALYRGLLWSLIILLPTMFLGASSAAGFAPWARCSTLWATCRRSRSAASSALNPIATSAGRRSNMWC